MFLDLKIQSSESGEVNVHCTALSHRTMSKYFRSIKKTSGDIKQLDIALPFDSQKTVCLSVNKTLPGMNRIDTRVFVYVSIVKVESDSKGWCFSGYKIVSCSKENKVFFYSEDRFGHKDLWLFGGFSDPLPFWQKEHIVFIVKKLNIAKLADELLTNSVAHEDS